MARNDQQRKSADDGPRVRGAENAQWLFDNQRDGYVVVSRDYFPIRHETVEGRNLEWATLDPWVHRASNYEDFDDAKTDIDATSIKPDVDLQPMPVSKWYPVFVQIIERRLRAIEAGAIVYDLSRVN